MPRATPPAGAPRQAHLEAHGPDRDRPTYDPLGAFETILEHSPLRVIIFDRDLVVREVSRPAAELARLPREEMRGQPLPGDVRAFLQERFERVFAGEAVFHEDKALPGFIHNDAWMRTMMLPIRDAAGAVWGAALIAIDISEHNLAEELVEKLALIDSVTELPNRTMLSLVLEKALSGAQANHRQLALVWLNLDRFKDVNDALGQQAGDELLRAVGERLHAAVRTVDVVARVGGDDFVLLLRRINSHKHVERLMARIHEVFAAPFVITGEAVLLSASCGIAVHPNGGADARQLRESAHSAMRAAKEQGGGACEIYDQGVVAEGSERLWLAREIREGIEQGQFVLHYQPQINLQTRRVQTVEALAR
ncbi:MAG TPA: diguanylate cyclase, partial [Coriobacteriia bacterium]|nr:diguanylate cyclase [Coriobacteriia bacterium]